MLGIKDPRHKQKIMLKAMDAVLFGPPKGETKFYDMVSLLYRLPLKAPISPIIFISK